MSTYTTYELRLRRQRKKELERRRQEERKQRVRQEATRLIAESHQASRQSTDHLVQHFGRDAQQQAERLAQQAEQLMQSNPDKALKLARKSRATAERGMAQASRKSANWTKEKIAAKEAVTVFELSLQSLLDVSGTEVNKKVTAVAKQLAEAKTALRRENFQLAAKLAVAGQKEVAQIEQARQQHQQLVDERREIVNGLRQVLGEMGFSVGADEQVNKEGKVVLEGSLPSGRRARFLISLDKKIESDFDGYSERYCPDDDPSTKACVKDSEQIRRRLEKQIQADSLNVKTRMKDGNPNMGSGGAVNIAANQRKNSA